MYSASLNNMQRQRGRDSLLLADCLLLSHDTLVRVPPSAQPVALPFSPTLPPAEWWKGQVGKLGIKRTKM